MAAADEGFASGIGYAGFKDWIKKIGRGIGKFIKGVAPTALKVGAKLLGVAAPSNPYLDYASEDDYRVMR